MVTQNSPTLLTQKDNKYCQLTAERKSAPYSMQIIAAYRKQQNTDKIHHLKLANAIQITSYTMHSNAHRTMVLLRSVLAKINCHKLPFSVKLALQSVWFTFNML